MFLRLFYVVALSIVSGCAQEKTLNIAVASNFGIVAEVLADDFSTATGFPVRISTGSTGKLYSQIVNGAPFDVFLAADRERPGLLIDASLAVPESRFTYVYGQLVLVSQTVSDCEVALRQGTGRIAIANQDVAPYGEVAVQYLAANDVVATDRLVLGENVAQVMHFVVTQNVEIGIVSPAQVVAYGEKNLSCAEALSPSRWNVQQDAVILKRTPSPQAAQAFVDYLRSEEALDTMRAYGFGAAVE